MKHKTTPAPRTTSKPKRSRRFLSAPSLGNERPTRLYSLLLPPTPPNERR